MTIRFLEYNILREIMLKLALRHLFRQPSFTIINITGLTLGIASCLLICLFVIDEMSYDLYYPDVDHIYRVTTKTKINGRENENRWTPAILAPTIVKEIPEVVDATRIAGQGVPVLEVGEKSFSEEGYYWADSSFFDVFETQFIHGTATGALSRPYTVVFTESMVKKYFGENVNPVGSFIGHKSGNKQYEITAVVKDPPRNTHFQYDFLGSLASKMWLINETYWLSGTNVTYFRVAKATPREVMEAKLNDFTERHIGPLTAEFGATDMVDFIEKGNSWEYHLQPVTEIHLRSTYSDEFEPGGSTRIVNAFILVAFLILLLACFNYINLSTSQAMNRAKEIGVRKTLGSSRNELIIRFITESVVITQIAVGLAVLLVAIILPRYNEFLAKELTIGMNNGVLVTTIMVFFTLVVGIGAGAYPALMLSSLNPVGALKGRSHPRIDSSRLRNSLVVAQFFVAIALIVGTLIVFKQLDYIRTKDLGFNRESLLVIEKLDDLGEQAHAFKDEVLNIHSIESATSTFNIMGNFVARKAMRLEGSDEIVPIRNPRVDHHFADTFQLELVRGRFFQRGFSSDSATAVINEMAWKRLGLETLEGAAFVQNPDNPESDSRIPIIGVVKDFHYRSLHEPIEPLLFMLWDRNRTGRHLSVKLNTDDPSSIVQSIEGVWKQFAGNQALEYRFFDAHFDGLYRTEIRFSVVFAAFTGLAIFIACLGLFGLDSHAAEQRTKEIGIRKIFGASRTNLILIHVRENVLLVTLSAVVAGPVAFFVMERWLSTFAYHIEIKLTVFLIATLGTLLIATCTVGIKTVQVTTANPINALRHE